MKIKGSTGVKRERKLKPRKESHLVARDGFAELDSYLLKCRIFDSGAGSIWQDLQRIFTEMGVKPVLIGGMAIRLFAEPVMTYDFDILLSRDDFLALKKTGKRYGLIYKQAGTFRYKDTMIECQVEGEKIGSNTIPSPELIRGERFSPTLEGIFFLKLLSFRPRDREHLSRLFSKGIDEDKLHVLIRSYRKKELWDRYQELKKFWTFK